MGCWASDRKAWILPNWWKRPPSGFPAACRITSSNWCCPPIFRMVLADSLLLEQAIFNLLDNAVKYAPAGTTIRLQAHLAEEQAWS